MALPMVGSAWGFSGRGHRWPARPHDRVPGLAFQPVGLPDLGLGGTPDQDRLPVVVGVDAVRLPDALCLGLAVATGERNMDDARGHALLKRAWVGLGKPLHLAARCRNCRYRPPEMLSGDQTKTSEAEAVVTEAITPACRTTHAGI
jgi:hypothetical protein